MTPSEVWVYLEVKRGPEMAGCMLKSDYDELMEMRGNGEGFI